MKRSIRKKLLNRTLLILLASIIGCAIISTFSMNAMIKRTNGTAASITETSVNDSSDALISLATEQAKEITSRSAQSIDFKMQSLFLSLQSAADEISDLYSDPDAYKLRPFSPPQDSPADTYCLQWVLPKDVEMSGDIQTETYLLGNMETLFSSMLRTYKNILSVYYTSSTGVNIGYDNTPQTKPPDYDGRNAFWYAPARDSGELYVSKPYGDSFDRGKMITVTMPCYNRDEEFVGVCGLDILIGDLSKIISGVAVGDNSYAMLATKDGVFCVSDSAPDDSAEFMEHLDSNSELASAFTAKGSGILQTELDGADVYCAYAPIENNTNWKVILVFSTDTITAPSIALNGTIEAQFEKSVQTTQKQLVIVFLLWIAVILTGTLIAIFSTRHFAKRITDPITRLCRSVEIVGAGDLNHQCNIRTDDEIGVLSDSFDKMTQSLKEYIENYTKVAAEKERISTELDIARQIQADMLPSIFPPFPDRNEFDIFASMTPAKEVGGDFYDFFMIDDDHLALIIADVSGKGIPAALFMVVAKTLIKDHAQKGEFSPSKIIQSVNTKLCEDNESSYFVTVWMAIVEISTGKGKAINAGHEHPALRRRGEDFKLIEYPHSTVVGIMDGLPFPEHDFTLQPGDTVFVYTDGVPEAQDASSELFGTERMLNALNADPDAELDALLQGVKASIDDYIGEAPQFDDLTMLGFTYYGTEDGS